MARGRGRIFERADEHFNKAVSVLASDTAERGRYLKQLQTAAVWTVVRRAAASSCVPRWSMLVRAGPCWSVLRRGACALVPARGTCGTMRAPPGSDEGVGRR